MSNRNPKVLSEPNSRSMWAPILLEPILGSGERVAVALVGCNATGDHEFLPLVNPKTATACFQDQAGYVKEVVALTVESCKSALKSGVALEDWEPPLQGVFLGAVQDVETSSVPELLHLAAPLSSFLYREPSGRSQHSNRPPKVAWERQVQEKVLQTNGRFSPNFNVLVYLGNHDGPAEFTFLSATYAANVVTLTSKRLKRGVEDARAKLWTLNLLADAPNYLFRPEARELLTGMDASEDDPKLPLIHEASEELVDEAQRRGIDVFPFSSPDAAAKRILDRAFAA